MKILGYCLMALGMLILMSAWTMDVSMPSPNVFSQDRIINHGLVADRLIRLQSGALFAIMGSIFIAAGALRDSFSSLVPAQSQPAVVPANEEAASSADEVPCPECSKPIRRQAVACKHCGAEFGKA